MNSNVERAVSLFKNGFSCSQALLVTYGVELGLNRETALKIATAFGGGMGSMGETCGAVTGAVMVIGLKYGMAEVNNKQNTMNSYEVVKKFINLFKPRNGSVKTQELVREFISRFRYRNSSIICRDLLGYDISKPEKLDSKTIELIGARCPKYVQDAAEILEEIL